jgi:hypothetical protein
VKRVAKLTGYVDVTLTKFDIKTRLDNKSNQKVSRLTHYRWYNNNIE